jgi:hypothetical protein
VAGSNLVISGFPILIILAFLKSVWIALSNIPKLLTVASAKLLNFKLHNSCGHAIEGGLHNFLYGYGFLLFLLIMPAPFIAFNIGPTTRLRGDKFSLFSNYLICLSVSQG